MKNKLFKTATAIISAMTIGATNVGASTIIGEDLVNVRTGNGTEYSCVGQLPYGTGVDVLNWDVGGGWAAVNTCFGSYYVYNALLTSIPDIDFAYSVANNYNSPTNKLIIADTNNKYVYVFRNEGIWVLENWFRCSVGKYETPTITGDFSVGRKRDFLDSGDTWEYYVTDFAYDENWEAYCFHSTLFEPATYNLVDDTVGTNNSNGCIRLHLDDAKYIWENCPYETRAIVL